MFGQKWADIEDDDVRVPTTTDRPGWADIEDDDEAVPSMRPAPTGADARGIRYLYTKSLIRSECDVVSARADHNNSKVIIVVCTRSGGGSCG